MMLRRTKERGYIRGSKVGSNVVVSLCVLHLSFADDKILFSDANYEQILYIWMVLTYFEAVTGLKVRVSWFLVVFGEVQNRPELADTLWYKIGCLPTTYLGMPLGASFKPKSVWNPIIEKMECRLLGWKKLCLSTRARLMLLKRTFWSLPTYYLSLFTILVSGVNKIEKF